MQYWGYILGFRVYRGDIGVILRIYWDNGKGTRKVLFRI